MSNFDIEKACQNALDYYEKTWHLDNSDNTFWQTANQIHSYIRFAEEASRTFQDQPKHYWFKLIANPITDISFAERFWIYTVNRIEGSSAWTDDFGWAGMACLSLSELLKNNSEYQNKNRPWQDWRDQGFKCMIKMNEGADSEASLGGAPVPNGISNCPIGEQDSTKFCKNTVTNANYFALAMSTYAYMKNVNNSSPDLTPRECLQRAYNQYVWFKGWINQRAISEPWPTIPFNFYHFLQTTGSQPYALLDERPVSIPPPATYSYKPNVDNPPYLDNPWVKPEFQFGEACWSGDQGLFFNACSLLLLNIEDFHSVLSLPSEVVAEMKTNVSNWLATVGYGITSIYLSSETDSILREGPFYCLYLLDPGDYMCGRGVLSRFLTLDASIWGLHGINMHPSDLLKCLHHTSEAIYNSRGKDNKTLPDQVSATWTTPLNDFNAQATFISKWNGHPQPCTFWWLYRDDPVWHNYCTMMAFDVYAAYLRVNRW